MGVSRLDQVCGTHKARERSFIFDALHMLMMRWTTSLLFVGGCQHLCHFKHMHVDQSRYVSRLSAHHENVGMRIKDGKEGMKERGSGGERE